jgi:hypothetical protein
MAADMTGEQMQAKITAARREAEGLKDKIRRRKDELADTSRTIFPWTFRYRSPDLNSENFVFLDGPLSGEVTGVVN